MSVQKAQFLREPLTVGSKNDVPTVLLDGKNTQSDLVFEGPVSGLEKDWNWTGLDQKKTGLQSRSLIFKNQRPRKDWSFWTGLDRFKPVLCTP